MDEIRSVRSTKPNPAEQMFTLDEVRKMDYLHAALSETLRLYPTVPLETRECAADDVLPDGMTVSKGRPVMYSSYAMGRTERIWGRDCLEFKPERWLENGVFQPTSPFRFANRRGGGLRVGWRQRGRDEDGDGRGSGEVSEGERYRLRRRRVRRKRGFY